MCHIWGAAQKRVKQISKFSFSLTLYCPNSLSLHDLKRTPGEIGGKTGPDTENSSTFSANRCCGGNFSPFFGDKFGAIHTEWAAIFRKLKIKKLRIQKEARISRTLFYYLGNGFFFIVFILHKR